LASRYEALKLKYVVTPATLAKCPPSAVLMHPLPRVGEIDPACDDDPRAAYFRQMEAGLFVRAAVLALVLGADLSLLL
jgi:aspartate carbamoyltransferase catalytic subunit